MTAPPLRPLCLHHGRPAEELALAQASIAAAPAPLGAGQPRSCASPGRTISIAA